MVYNTEIFLEMNSRVVCVANTLAGRSDGCLHPRLYLPPPPTHSGIALHVTIVESRLFIRLPLDLKRIYKLLTALFSTVG